MMVVGSERDYHTVLERILPRAKPAFEDPAMQLRVWGERWGCRNDVGNLRMVLVHRPGDEVSRMTAEHYDPNLGALINDDEQWYFRSQQGPNVAKMQQEHDGLVKALEADDIVVHQVSGSPRDPKAMYTRDCAVAVDGGVIVCRMGPVGKEAGTGRRGEERFITGKLVELGMPILRTIHGEGLFEGGSFCYLDERHAAAGLAHRQNEEGVRQVEEVLRVHGVTLIRVSLTGHSLHLDGCIVMTNRQLALVNVARLPYWFLETLNDLGIKYIQPDPLELHCINYLAVNPGRVLFPYGAPRTAEKLEREGISIVEIDYSESAKNGGGIHCSTLPLIRDD